MEHISYHLNRNNLKAIIRRCPLPIYLKQKLIPKNVLKLALHLVCWIRDIVKFQLVLSLGFPKIFTSVVPYLSLSFSAILSSLSLIIGVKWALLKQGGNYHAWFITSTFTITLKSVAAEFINKCTSKFESEWVTLHIAYTVNWNCCPLLPNAGLVSHMHLSLNFWQRLVSVP